MLGEPQGRIKNLIVLGDGVNKRVAGIKTCDGQEHLADLVVVAGKRRDIFLVRTDTILRWGLVCIDHS